MALADAALAGGADLSSVKLVLHLGTDIRKYQRISHIKSDILEKCATSLAGRLPAGGGARARVTAVFSPAGGVGKTAVALAYAMRRAVSGREVTYISFEHFASTPAYFPCGGKSISVALASMDSGDLGLLLKSLCDKDPAAGVSYYCPPDNYDDMNILTAEEVAALIEALSGITEELVVDLPAVCDERARQVFGLADRVFLVSDQTAAAAVKLNQFVTQHNVYERIRHKTTLVANKGARIPEAHVSLPFVQSGDAMSVCRVLAGTDFGG